MKPNNELKWVKVRLEVTYFEKEIIHLVRAQNFPKN